MKIKGAIFMLLVALLFLIILIIIAIIVYTPHHQDVENQNIEIIESKSRKQLGGVFSWRIWWF